MTDKEKIKRLQEKLDKLEKEKEKSTKRKIWITKKGLHFFIGSNLKNDILKTLNEFSDNKRITNNTLADLANSLIKRVIRIGFFPLLVGVFPIILLFIQNGLIGVQNSKIEEQTKLFDKQTELISNQNALVKQQLTLSEASRRSGQMFIMNDVLKDINTELEDKNNTKKILSNTLVGRIISLSRAMKPYRYMENDTLIDLPLSPERGQLIISLAESRIDTTFLRNNIFSKADFSYSDLNYANLENLYLSNAVLFNSSFKKAYITNSVLSHANLIKANFTDAVFKEADMSFTFMQEANLTNAKIISTNFFSSTLNNANLTKAHALKSDFSYAILNGAKIDSLTILSKLDRLSVDRKDWLVYIKDSLKLKGSQEINQVYKIDSSRIISSAAPPRTQYILRRSNSNKRH